MLNQSNKVSVRQYAPKMALVASASDDGMIRIRTSHGIVAFFPDDDYLEAKVGPRDAEHFAQIPGFEVEGYEPALHPPVAVADFMLLAKEEGDRAKSGKSDDSNADLLKHLITLMAGGGSGLKEMMETAAREALASTVTPAIPIKDPNLLTTAMIGELPFEKVEQFILSGDKSYDSSNKEPKQLVAKLMKMTTDNPILEREVFAACNPPVKVSAKTSSKSKAS